jgi:hypothetical protein
MCNPDHLLVKIWSLDGTDMITWRYRYDHLLYRYDHLLYRDDHLLYRYDHLLYRYDHSIYQEQRLSSLCSSAHFVTQTLPFWQQTQSFSFTHSHHNNSRNKNYVHRHLLVTSCNAAPAPALRNRNLYLQNFIFCWPCILMQFWVMTNLMHSFLMYLFTPVHVSSSKCSSSGEPNCINTSSGITLWWVTVWRAGLDRHVRQSLTRVCYTRWCINTIWPSWWWALAARNM